MRFIDTLTDWIGKVTSFACPLIMAIVLWEILVRRFTSGTIWANDLTAMIFGAYAMLAGAYTFQKKAHVTIDLLTKRLGPRTNAVLDLFTSIFFFAFCYVIVWHGGVTAWESLLNREFLVTQWAPPLYPYKLLVVFSGVLILLQGVMKFIRDVRIVAGRKEKAWTPS